MPQLTIVVPVYNESRTIRQILSKIASVNIDKEIIVIDNFSTDGTQQILQGILKSREIGNIKVIYHSHNKGKGCSVREGIEEASGGLVVIQDADLEYDPQDYMKLMKPILAGEADIALGCRFSSGHSGLFIHRMGNKFLTGLVNFLFGKQLNDYATCYKMARRSTFLGLGLKSCSFDIEVEVVCRAIKAKLRIAQVPVSYYPRSYSEGKKIRWFDGLHAIASILKYRYRG